MAVSSFLLRTREHTFSTGRTALINPNPNFFELMQVVDLEQIAEGGLPTFDALRSIATLVFVQPKIVDTLDDCDEAGTERITLGHLDSSETLEMFDLFREVMDSAARFQHERLSVDDGEDGGEVDDKPKPPARSSKRKSRSVAA